MIVLLPTYIIDQINAKLDEAYVDAPDAAVDRAHHYQALVNYFAETGQIPGFSLKKAEAA